MMYDITIVKRVFVFKIRKIYTVKAHSFVHSVIENGYVFPVTPRLEMVLCNDSIVVVPEPIEYEISSKFLKSRASPATIQPGGASNGTQNSFRPETNDRRATATVPAQATGDATEYSGPDITDF